MSYMFIVSEEVPVFTDVGKKWYKPSEGQIFSYLNGGWRPFVGGETIEYDYPLTVFIRGIKRKKIQRPYKKVDAITQQVDTLSFELYDEDGTVQPTQGEEVIIFKKSSVSAVPVKCFGGHIKSALPIEDAPGSTKFTYYIECYDYSHRLNNKHVIQTYTDKTENYIVNDIVTNFATEFSANNVSSDVTISFISFNEVPCGQAIKEIARRIGRDFYVDYDRDIHLFAGSEENEAPYELTEDINTTGHYKNLRIKVDDSQLRNRIIVTGGIYLDPYDDKDIRVADGEETSFKTKYLPRGDVQAFVDVGAGFVEKTVGIDNIDTTGYDFVVNAVEGTLRNLDLAKLANGHILKINYDREIRVKTQDDDQNSIDALIKIEGGDGVHMHPVRDETIDTVAAAHERGQAELSEYSNPMIQGSYWTDQSGYRSGQLLTVNMSLRRYPNRQFLIQKVTETMRADGTTFGYDIVFATRLKGLAEFLIELYDSGKQLRIREEDTLHDLIKLASETVLISDATPTFVERNIDDNPYTWGVDANQGIWDEAQWG